MASRNIADNLIRVQKLAERAKKARRTMHSEKHALADELIRYCGEPRSFPLFLGRIKKVGLPVAYQAFSDLKDGVRRRKVKEPGKWWMWRTKDLQSPKKNVK